MIEPALIIGGGHNGLVCAAYLARAGVPVQVLEASDRLGGAAITREFAPGFRVSACAHLLNQMDPGVARDLGLKKHGLRLAGRILGTVALSVDGPPLTISGGQASGGGITPADQAALAQHHRRMRRFSRLLGRLYGKAPPRLRSDRRDLFDLARFAMGLRLMGRREMREFMRIIGINMFDVLEEQFEHDGLKGALGLDAVLGNHLGPRSNNTVFNALHRMTGAPTSLPQGGLGAVTQAMAASAREAGAILSTGCPVENILSDGERVTGVTLASGEVLSATTVISSVDPKTTFLGLLGARNLDAGFAQRIQHLRCKGNAAKLHLALDGLPEFRGVDPDRLSQRLVFSPSLTALERAFDHSKYGETSTEPALEINLPSLLDPGLAPSGQHVLSAVVQYAPYDLVGGWEDHKQAFTDRLIDQLETMAPGLGARIVGSELLTPVDIEREFRITGGHWHHAELTLDQALMLRPVPGAGQYDTPVDGLYLCGAGTHPGGGVMGCAGRNAAARVREALQ